LEAPLSDWQEAVAAPLACEVRVGAHTDAGQVRGENEDRLLIFDLGRGPVLSGQATVVVELQPHPVLLLVADGMGGMSGGEQASQMCADLLPEKLLHRVGHKGATREQVRQALVEAVGETNRIIFNRATSDIRLRGMGCTLTAALLAEDRVMVAQVGDSRAYLGRAGKITQLTRDQTVWESLREAGKDPEGALAKGQFQSMLLQAVGAQETVQVAITEMELQAGDWLVLCTDGLYRVVDAQEIAQIVEAKSDPAQKARALTDLANQHGGPDNVSVVVCQVAGKSSERKGVAVAA
jgi:protein phosphatase